MLNYAQDAKIDENALDIEWLNHAAVVEKYIAQYLKLSKKARLLEEELKITRSELIIKANRDPVKHLKKEKPNAQDIEAFYRTDEEYIRIKEEMITAQEEARAAEDMKNLMNFTKTKALENLVTLHGQGYFAGPSVPRNIKKESERYKERKEEENRLRQERKEKIGKKLKRRK